VSRRVRLLGIALAAAALLAGYGSAGAQTPPPLPFPRVAAERTTLAVTIGTTAKVVHLEAAIYRPAGDGPFPLVILNHGTGSRDPVELRRVQPDYVVPSSWFVSKGYIVIVPLRRGYGRSDGPVADLPFERDCAFANYVRSGDESAADVLAVMAYARTLPYVDATRIVLVGHSAGGWAVAAALRHDPPVLGAIMFAAGRGEIGPGPNTVCHPDDLVAAARLFGTSSRRPTLWLYAANDRFFDPPLAHALFAAFSRTHPGNDTFVDLPAFGADGHAAIYGDGFTVWSPAVEAFLARISY